MKSCALLVLLAVLLATVAGCTGGPGTGKATLQGQVTIGPLCPVERPDRPCLPTPETYVARKVVVFRPDGATVVTTVPLNQTGYYRVNLDPGTYVVDINHAGIDRSPDVPRTVILDRGETVTLDIAIDTGLR
ncbi:MAG: carboxypeptidase-like regulatory domain-containing protein [Methanomicrobiales archaeon]|nr:carboxypeptidase-like regulatory domain-containing protein [Methanomicrobiales archaeon]MDD1654771.1 carboxypeptidase-like regulatory domain-containing protein [Methanomicrobiales archaeon]